MIDFQQQITQDPLLSLKYQFIEKLGEGCFGKIYKVKNKELKIVTAMKFEIIQSKSKRSMLENQADILKTIQGKPLVPHFYFFGQWTFGTFLQIELLVTDLNSLVQKPFNLDQISTLTAKLFHSLAVLHNSNVIHQDIKPQNIMINSKSEYVFIDFGISKRVKESPQRNQQKRTRGFIGTPRYASIQAHKGLQQSKKDDLESLMYNIAFLYFKKLPWLSLKVSGNKKIQQIKNTKLKTADGVFQQMGKHFAHAFSYIKRLQANEDPNFKYLISIFKRNNTVVVDNISASVKMQQVKQTRRSETKKLSLNPRQGGYGKYLELPFMQKSQVKQVDVLQHKILTESTKINQLNLMGNSMNCSRQISMRAYNESDQISKEEESQTVSKDMDLKDEQNQEPCVPDISKFFSPLNIKNPFAAGY